MWPSRWSSLNVETQGAHMQVLEPTGQSQSIVSSAFQVGARSALQPTSSLTAKLPTKTAKNPSAAFF